MTDLIAALLYVAASDLWNTHDETIPWEVWCDLNLYCEQYEVRS